MDNRKPEGWVRGEPLTWIGKGPRYAAMLDRPYGAPSEDIGALEFDTLAEARAFKLWWNQDNER